jgi:hypothetical protein
MQLIEEDFNGLETGAYPSGWKRDGSESQQVVATESHEGSHSLEMSGSHGSCWEAIANAPLGTVPEGETVTFSGAVKPAVQGSIGCHDTYGQLKLRNAAGSWSTGRSHYLLRFGTDGTLSGRGIEVGEFTRGEWLEYEITYRYDSDAGEVTLNYTIDGKSRGSSTVEAGDVYSEWSYLSFYTGDFTSYWDSLSVQTGHTNTETATPTPTPTPTPKPTRTPPPTETKTATPQTPDHNLRKGSTTTVNPHGQPLYVISEIPNTDPGRQAVTTTEYQLVDATRAKDALAAAYYQTNGSTVDYSQRLQTARDHKERAKNLQLFGRAVDAGWDLTVIANSFLVGHPQLAIGNAISLSTDAMSWGYTEYTDPFQEGFTKMTAALTNAKSIQAKAQQMRVNDNLGKQVGSMISALALGADTAKTGAGLATAWDEAFTALKQSRFPTHTADDVLKSADDLAKQSVDDAVTASAGLFAGFAIGLATSEISSVIKAKTKVHTAELAYETVRIPLLERLEQLQSLARAGQLTHPEAIEYTVSQATEMQMGAILFQIGADYWQAISDSATGFLWDIVSNAAAKSENYEANATSLETTSKWLYLGSGSQSSTVIEQYALSLNADALGGEN